MRDWESYSIDLLLLFAQTFLSPFVSEFVFICCLQVRTSFLRFKKNKKISLFFYINNEIQVLNSRTLRVCTPIYILLRNAIILNHRNYCKKGSIY